MRAKTLVVIALCAVTTLLSGCVAESTPSPTLPPSRESRLPPVADPLPLEQLEAFGSVARLEMGANCTGTLIDTGVPEAPGYILTNGHCTGDVGRSPQVVTTGEEWFGTAEFFAAQGNEARVEAEAEVLEYSTMRGRDLAIVRLRETLGELEHLGVRAVPIADVEPDVQSAVANVGVPVQGLDHEDWVLRRGDCALSDRHTVIEFAWLWFGIWANDCPGIVQGSSGSPLFTLDAQGEPEAIVSMINTTSWGVTADDGGACALNRPCQLLPGGAEMVEETSYGVSVAGVGRCFDASGVFALGGECPLETSSVWATRGGGSFRGDSLPNANAVFPEVSLVGVAGPVRSAVVPLITGDECLRESTYGEAAIGQLPPAGEPWEDGLILPVDLPAVEGHYVLCAVAGSDYAGAASVLFDVDRTPPLFPADASIEKLDDAVLVRPHLNSPEIATVRFTWGPVGTIDCADTAGFQDFFIVPAFIERDELPATYCIYGLDAAGNTTPVTEIDIPAP